MAAIVVVLGCAQPVRSSSTAPELVASSKQLWPDVGAPSPRLVEDRWRIPPGHGLSIEVELEANGGVTWNYTANRSLHWTTSAGFGSVGFVRNVGEAARGGPSIRVRGAGGRYTCTWRNDSGKPVTIEVQIQFIDHGTISSIDLFRSIVSLETTEPEPRRPRAPEPTSRSPSHPA
jgi:hypothetical protein